ncbi:hypothetical protein BJ138DRAFT_1078438 [Hygrophoropsis aurantiaca]|uniref:Uncharacterized protein n=1 Tax=Hygrophoropsis aurantiaca TaxID=72124 RepID=A0ACB8APF8_9AGAM|nr:hypothetical protein BJ138DRAFT_1078438 [Hygrophoropsis aurantiaca]
MKANAQPLGQPQPVTDRSKIRMAKLKELELEQQQWDREALVMAEDLNQTLILSFKSVKTEFSDLDGLSWSRHRMHDWVAEDPTPKASEFGRKLSEFPLPPSYTRRTVPVSPYAVSTRAELASFAPHETIRASRLSKKPSRSPLLPSNQWFGVTGPVQPVESSASLCRRSSAPIHHMPSTATQPTCQSYSRKAISQSVSCKS